MNWKMKAYIQSILSIMPCGTDINYLIQRLFRVLPFSKEVVGNRCKITDFVYSKFAEYSDKYSTNKNYYEFGCGIDLQNAICMSAKGFKELYCIDLYDLVRPKIVNNSLKHINDILKENNDGVYFEFINSKSYLKSLYDNFNINYMAPHDARLTGFENDTIDFICTNLVLEHIGKDDLSDIIKETYRVLKPGGIVSHIVDYRDHWAAFDNNISVYNYLQFTDKQWKCFNPSLHYQNRLRHPDYIKMFSDAGFIILEENPRVITSISLNSESVILHNKNDDDYVDMLNNILITPEFMQYDINDLAVTMAHYVLKK